MAAYRDPDRDKSTPLRPPPWLKPVVPRAKPEPASRGRYSFADRDSQSSTQGAQPNGNKSSEGYKEFNPETLDSWAGKYSLGDPHEPLRAHRQENSLRNFVGRQAAWSPGGEWCVIVGSSNFAVILQRWAKKAPPKQSEPPKNSEV